MLGYVVAVWAVAIIGGLLPYAVSGGNDGKGNPWPSVLNVMSGGVFVAAGFMHLLPEAQESLEKLSEEFDFEFALFFASLGFIAVFLLEEVVEKVSASVNPHKHYTSLPSAAGASEGIRNKGKKPPAAAAAPLHPPRCHYDRLQLHPADGGGEICYHCGVNRSNSISSVSSAGGAFRGGGVWSGGRENGTGSGAAAAAAISRHASVGIGVGYGISSLEGAGRLVDENYHLCGSSVGSRFPSSPRALVLDRKHYPKGSEAGAAETVRLKGGEALAEWGEAGPAGIGGGGYPGALRGGDVEGGKKGAVRLGNFEDLCGSVGDSKSHMIGLRGNGPARAGVKRLGSKGDYGTIVRSSPVLGIGSGDRRFSSSGSVNSRGGSDLKHGLSSNSVISYEAPTSPSREGQGPWIGRKLVGSDPDPADSSDLDMMSSSNLLPAEARLLAGRETDAIHPSEEGVARGHKHTHSHAHGPYSANVGLILGAALSFHSVVEGLGLGASSQSSAPGIFAAIVFHKGLVAFSLGSIFFSSEISRLQYFLFMGVFSLLTPLGAIVGMVICAHTEGSAGAGICTALGAGTFLHVAAMEVLPRDLLHDQRMKKTKMVALVLGYLVFAWLSLYV